MEEIELMIIKKISEIYQKTRLAANSNHISRDLGLTEQDTFDFLEMLADQGYVRLERYGGGVYLAFLTHTGRLLLTHPEYMLNKGYGDASDVLKALERAVNDSNDIPQQEKDSISGKLKELYHDPYMQSIGSQLIVEGLKKLVGI